uniref:Uncharacterized protein n=1 Tax=Timema poppense TaxID=170557 RepID=A0A7R9D2Z6_TIMPO|nr:unnamed protein product [Timema poppensis]
MKWENDGFETKTSTSSQVTAFVDPYVPNASGQPSWGIAWYINDMLIPEIYVERGQTYSFVVEGGNDRTNPARYHPFYITDSKEGGFGQKSEADQKKQRVFGGVSYDAEGYPYPTAGNTTPSSPKQDLNLDIPDLGSVAQHETSKLDNYAYEAGHIDSY